MDGNCVKSSDTDGAEGIPISDESIFGVKKFRGVDRGGIWLGDCIDVLGPFSNCFRFGGERFIVAAEASIGFGLRIFFFCFGNDIGIYLAHD